MKFENQAKFTLITAVIHTITNGTIKISVLLFYRRVGESALSRRFILTTQVALAGTVLTMLASLLCMLLLCRPLDALWKRVSLENMMLAAKLQASGGADEHSEAVAAVKRNEIPLHGRYACARGDSGRQRCAGHGCRYSTCRPPLAAAWAEEETATRVMCCLCDGLPRLCYRVALAQSVLQRIL
jgi:hypothetical protein